MDKYNSIGKKDDNINFLTAEEISSLLRIPLRTIYHLSKTGKIKGIKIGKLWRYNKTDFRDELFHKAERRSYPRINSNLKCLYSINLPPFKDIHNKGIIKNISVGGILLIVQGNEIKEIEIDDPIDLAFEISGNIKINGKVARKTEKALGIRFRDMPKGVENRIKQYAG